MTYDLFLGDRTYSSWSLRGWLMFEKFGLPARTHFVGLYTGTMQADLADLAPARLVPVMRTPDGHVVQDTLAMGETLAEAHPGSGLWPSDPGARALARGITAEMHSGFLALRAACAMNLEHGWAGFAPSDEVKADLQRIETLWSLAREQYGADGAWLFGCYSLADVFYAPVAARIAGYGLPVGPQAQDYVQAHLNDRAFRRWRAMGLTVEVTPKPYSMDLPKAAWPGPTPLPAQPVASGPSVNAACPYSGDPVTHYMEMDGKTYGFCNAFCRDKTVNDPDAWPKFMDIYQS